MTDPNVAILLGGNMRVIRGKVTLEHLTAVFPTLSEQAASNSSSLTDADRRPLLDLPDEDEETANIASVSTRTKAELIAQALQDPLILSKAELELFSDNFWCDITDAEIFQRAGPTSTVLTQGSDEILRSAFDAIQAVQMFASLPNERAAMEAACRELTRREMSRFRADRIQDAGGQERLERAESWVKQLHNKMADDNEGSLWGYVCYLDVYTRSLSPTQLQNIWCRMDMFLHKVHDANTTDQGPAFGRWYIQYIRDGPHLSPTKDDGTIDVEAIAAFRNHFSHILTQAPKCRYPAKGDILGAGLATGLLRNTFLIFDKNACDSITTPPSYPDDFKILAVEYPFHTLPTPQIASLSIADSTKPSSGKIEEYTGTSFVRITQLPHNFYEQRWLHGDEAGNFETIWKAAKQSRNEAFVSLDEVEFEAYANSMDVFTAVEMVPLE